SAGEVAVALTSTAWVTRACTLVEGQLRPMWRAGDSGTSPVVAGGLLFVYDPGGGVRVYDAPTGRRIAKLECGRGHWNSLIVVDGRIALPEGNSNDHATSGILDIWRLRRRSPRPDFTARQENRPARRGQPRQRG